MFGPRVVVDRVCTGTDTGVAPASSVAEVGGAMTLLALQFPPPRRSLVIALVEDVMR